MYVLDTDILSLVNADHPKVRAKSDQIDDAEIAITVITKVEVLRARFDFVLKAANGKLLRAQQWLQRSEELLAQLEVIEFDEDAASEFDALLLQKKLKKIGRADLLIASIVLARRDILVTRNVKHFRQVP